MEEKLLVKGTMRKNNILSILSLIVAGYFLLGGCIASVVNGNPADLVIGFFGGACGFGLSKLFQYLLNCYEITITDKRVYGKGVLGKRVDLPIDSVSAVGSRWPGGITIATSSGRISFLRIKNRDEVHKSITDLLIGRQNKIAQGSAPAVVQEIAQSNADELKKYKELLDMGAITQEEFDEKKKQLLGL